MENVGGKKQHQQIEAETPVSESALPLTFPSQYQEAGGKDLCALCGEENTCLSWNTCVSMATSTT